MISGTKGKSYKYNYFKADLNNRSDIFSKEKETNKKKSPKTQTNPGFFIAQICIVIQITNTNK